MTARRLPFALALLLTLAGCQRDEAGPVELAGKVFIFNYRNATATYVLTLRKVAPFTEGSTALTRYENPAGGPPVEVETKIFPFWEKIALESPPMHCIVKDRPYRVEIELRGPDRRLLQKLDTTLTSTLDQSILPGKPLVVGPVYTPNPAVYDAAGTADYAQERCDAAGAGAGG